MTVKLAIKVPWKDVGQAIEVKPVEVHGMTSTVDIQVVARFEGDSWDEVVKAAVDALHDQFPMACDFLTSSWPGFSDNAGDWEHMVRERTITLRDGISITVTNDA